MTSLASILKNFYFEPVNENKFHRFGKAGRVDYIFTYKRSGSTSQPMNFHQDLQYRLSAHLVRYCNPSSSSEQKQHGSE